MKQSLILLSIIMLLVSCNVPDSSNVPPATVPPENEETKEEVKDPYEESPLSSVSIEVEETTQDLQGTWLMSTGGNITDKLIICLDNDGRHGAVYAEKEGKLLTTMSFIQNSVIYRLWISGYAQYEPLAYRWDDAESLTVTYTDRNTYKKTIHSMYKYSDSFINEVAFDDSSLLYGLWVNADKSKGLRFISDGILWTYKGNSSEKCKWKDSDNNALLVMDSFGFSEKIPFVKIGENLLVYNGEKYYKAD